MSFGINKVNNIKKNLILCSTDFVENLMFSESFLKGLLEPN